MKRELLTLLLAIVVGTTFGRAEIINGSCGDNLTWTIDDEKETLVISGTGEMTSEPWRAYSYMFKHVIIEEGVSSIVDYAFSNTETADVSLPNSLKSIGNYAFYNCLGLKTITIPEGVESVGQSVFEDCMNMRSATWNTKNCPDIHKSVFGYYYGGVVDTITIGENVEAISYNAFNTDTRYITIYWNAKHFKDVENYSQRPLLIAYIKNLIIGDKVEYLPAFFLCGQPIKSFVIPNTVTSIGESAFDECTSLETITLSENLTSIPSKSFYKCKSLKSIVIPNSVKSIAKEAFSECPKLESVTIGDGCKSIGDYAFYRCINLEKVHLGKNLESIGAEVFNGYYNDYCKKLTSIELPNSLVSIDEYAFANTALTQITIPENVTFIGAKAFNNCTHLHRVEWNAKAATLGESSDAFPDYNSIIAEFVIGENVESIPAKLCSGISSMVSIKVPDNIISVGEEAFGGVPNVEYQGALTDAPWGAYSLNGYVEGQLVYESQNKTQIRSCSSLQKDPIRIPASVTSIRHLYASPAVEMICEPTTPPQCLSNVESALPEHLRLVHVPAGKKAAYKEAWYGNYDGEFVFAEPTEEDIVEVVNDSLSWSYNPASKIMKFIGYGKMPDDLGNQWAAPWQDYKTIIDSVWIDPRITYIGNYTFYGMTHLKSLTIPETIESMGYNLIMNSGVEEIHYFSNAGNVGLVINNGIISGPQGGWIVGESQMYFPFKGANVEKTTLHIGKNVKVLPDFLFCGTTNLGDVVLPDSIEYIGYGTFANCGITSINIPNTCIYLGGEALTNNDLAELILPEGLLHLGKFFMDNNPRLTEITIPSTITELCDEFCNGTTHLQKIHFAPGSQIKRVGKQAFYNADHLVECKLPEGVTEIDDRAFYGCSAFSDYKIPSAVRKIGEYAYCGTPGADSLVLPASLREIGNRAFDDVTHLNHVWIGDSIETVGYSALVAPILRIHTNNLSAWCQRDNSNFVDYNRDTTYFYVNEELMTEGSILRIPNDVKEIHDDAFQWINLRGVTIQLGDSVEYVGDRAFILTFFKNLKTNKLLSSIGEHAFARGTSTNSFSYYHIVDTVLLESGIKYLAKNCFNGNEINTLQYNITYPYYDIEAFTGGSSIHPIIYNVEFLDDVSWIPDNLLKKQTSLTITAWSDSITSIGANAFQDCGIDGMPERFPKNLTYIGNYAFQNTYMSRMPKLNDYLYEIGEHAFDGAYTYNFYQDDRIDFPEGLMRIGGYAFNNCDYIYRLRFKARTQLDEYAFNGCTSIDSIYCTSRTPAVCSASAFEGLDKFSCRLCVPAGTKGMYQVATGWRDFYYVEEQGYTITFVNWDGEELLTLYDVEEGTIPEYNGETPSRPEDDEYTYSFKGWEPEIVAVTEDATYTATFESTPKTKSYTITFINWDGEELLTLYDVEEGTIPEYTGETPSRPDDDDYTYTFTGWEPEIVAATENATYTATFESTPKTKTYTITFVNWDDEELLTLYDVVEGTVPEYTGQTPTRPDDDEYTYTFTGWEPEIVAAIEDATYTATYDQTPKSDGIEDIRLNDATPHKAVIDGQLYILRNGKMYTVQGEEVR